MLLGYTLLGCIIMTDILRLQTCGLRTVVRDNLRSHLWVRDLLDYHEVPQIRYREGAGRQMKVSSAS